MASSPPGKWGSVFSALVSPELSLGVKLRLNATELRAANAIVEVMGQDGHSDEEISDVARALVTMQPSLVLVHLILLIHFFLYFLVFSFSTVSVRIFVLPGMFSVQSTVHSE